jgi:hypothetical protein
VERVFAIFLAAPLDVDCSHAMAAVVFLAVDFGVCWMAVVTLVVLVATTAVPYMNVVALTVWMEAVVIQDVLMVTVPRWYHPRKHARKQLQIALRTVLSPLMFLRQ